jgi:hypothetical protein
MKDSKLKNINSPENNNEKKYEISLTKMERLNDLENQYNCCIGGGSTDKRILNFISKCSVLFSILIFSFVMVAREDKNSSIYLNIIFIIMSIFIPSPSISSSNEKK